MTPGRRLDPAARAWASTRSDGESSGNGAVMRLELMTEEDVELRIRMETDPGLMSELGGPRPKEDIERAHAKSLLLAAEGECWPMKIIPDGSKMPAGNVDIFRSSHDGKDIYEIGWMILPEFQGRGLASRAVHEMLERARNERKLGRPSGDRLIIAGSRRS